MLFYYPDPKAKTKEYSHHRQEATLKYGDILACVLLMVVLSVPLMNMLLAKGYWFLNKFHILRAINQFSDKHLFAGGGIVKRVVYGLYLNFGTLFQIALWASVFTVLGMQDINNGDLIFVGKRLGRFCAVSLPTVFFLTLRPSPLPHTLYLALLPIHKWLSRTVVLMGILHTIVYCGYFHVNHNWAKAWKPANLYGWAAVCGFVMIAITSVLRIRDRSYKTFFLNHYFWSWCIVLCLPFHIRPINTNVANALNIGILLYQAVWRLYMTRVLSSNEIKITDVSPNLAVVEFPNSLIANRAINPGAHVRITNYHPNVLVRIYKQLIPNYHPYTLVSLPLDRQQRLIVRKSSFEWKNGRRYMIFGTFDPKLLLIKSNNTPNKNFLISKLSVNARKILIVIGGSAVSFAIPILRVANYHGIPIKVIWVIRDFRDVTILRHFEGMIHGDDFEIFVTGSPTIVEPFSAQLLRNSSSYGTFMKYRRISTSDIEAAGSSRLIPEEEYNFANQEVENVDVDFSDDENSSLHEECTQDLQEEWDQIPYNDVESSGSVDPLRPVTQNNHSSKSSTLGSTPKRIHIPPDAIQIDGEYDCTSVKTPTSRRTSRSQNNEPFIPILGEGDQCHEYYMETISRLHLTNRIYKGRPILNYRYYNWCVNESDIFTQCSGPVLDDAHNLVCCKDLPGRQHVISANKKLPDLQRVWVISAGPKSLVKNTNLWANENGLKYHEEAFYV